jgi:hypothetical protein
MHGFSIGRESPVVATLAEGRPVAVHTLVHMSVVLCTRARDPQCHSH